MGGGEPGEEVDENFKGLFNDNSPSISNYDSLAALLSACFDRLEAGKKKVRGFNGTCLSYHFSLSLPLLTSKSLPDGL